MANYWKDLPPWAKGTVVVAGVLAIGGIGLAIYWKIKRSVGSKDDKQETQSAKQELTSLKQQGVQPTISETQAQSMCNVILESAGGCDPFGQGATEIMNTIYSLKNAADWYLLLSTFGVRSWSDCPAGTVQGNLTTLLVSELDTPQITEARRHVGQFNVTI